MSELELKKWKDRCLDLESQVATFIKTKQNLIDTKHGLDIELARFRTFQDHIDRALTVDSVQELLEITLEAFAEAFEVELCFILLIHPDGGTFLIAKFGLEDDGLDSLQINEAISDMNSAQLFLESSELLKLWKASIDLHEAVIAPYHNRDGEIQGYFVSGRSKKYGADYEVLSKRILSSYDLFCHLSSTLLGQLELTETIANKNEELTLLTQSYRRFVPQQFLKAINKERITDLKLGDHVETEMTILFSDIRDFTTISENLSPRETFGLINSYLEIMEPVVENHKGFIDKYIGDAIMALFDVDADCAVMAAIKMQQKLVKFNQNRIEKIKIGIGINTGPLMLGTIGGHNRMEGTVISDAVNLASRLEGLTKLYDIGLLISENTCKALNNSGDYDIRYIDRVKVKGKSKAIRVFEVFDADSKNKIKQKRKSLEVFETARKAYHMQDLTSSENLFRQCIEICPEDKVAQVYVDRCRHYATTGYDFPGAK